MKAQEVGRSCLADLGRLCEGLTADCPHHRKRLAQRRIAFGAEGAAQPFARRRVRAESFGHALGLRSHALGMCRMRGIVRFRRGAHDIGDGLIRFQVLGRFKGREFFRHGRFFVSAASILGT